MFNFEKIAGKLSGLKSSREFEAVVPELADQLEAAQMAAVDLKDRLETAIFSSPKEVPFIQADIAKLEAEQGALRLAIAGAQRRQQEAAAIEVKAEVERRASEAKKVRVDLLDNYAQLHESLTKVASLLHKIQDGEATLKAVRELLAKHGRRELVVHSPFSEALSLMEVSPTAQLDLSLGNIRIPGYFPGGGRASPISIMKKIKA
ncbi:MULTISPECIES: hypothetical protein [unclassified Afipia]|uniref:hypothetical protein n=1 Tax=unclassified Afipia TaxID=2642050 RepID=UPI00040FEE1E|nr:MULTISPECIES: hypothetical protein [unclassified Afipia]